MGSPVPLPVTCPKCGLPMQTDDQYVTFRCGKSPMCALEVKLRAEWCPNSGCTNTTVTVIPNKSGKIP